MAMPMKEAVVKDLIGNNLVRLMAGGVQDIYPDSYSGRPAGSANLITVQSPIVLSQLACSPSSQILSFFSMETDSLLRLGKRMFPDRSKEDALKLVVSANAEILNFVSSRLAWLLSKLENIDNTEISPPKIGNFTGRQAYRIRPEEGICFDFTCASQNLAFRYAACIQSLNG
jgi:hypothetical protein